MSHVGTVDHSGMKLGKLPPVHDPRVPLLANYLDRRLLPPVPVSRSWLTHDIAWGMGLNDTINDCVVASQAHMIKLWTADSTGVAADVPDPAILQAYRDLSGYIPGQPATDTGTSMIEGLSYFQRIGIAGHKILGSASVQIGNRQLASQAINLFGVLDIGLALPKSGITQAIWDVPPGGAVGDALPGSWGLHNVPCFGFDINGLICVTWGAVKRLTWKFWRNYCDESFAVLSGDWLANNRSPGGLNLGKLKADLAII